MRVEGACDSGGLALTASIKTILADIADVVLCVGVEVQNSVKAIYGADYLAAAGWFSGERKNGHAYFFPDRFSQRAGACFEKFGKEKVREGMAQWYVNAIENARKNPKAQEYHNRNKDLFDTGMTPPNPKAFCEYIKGLNLPLFMPFEKDGRSAVCFMVRPAMIEQIGYFDEDYAPIGIAEDLEYFLRIERILLPSWLTEVRYPESDTWKAGFCGKSIVHHNWCSTRQGPHFDGRKWDKAREKNWKSKFGKSRKYYTKLFT